MIDRLDDRHTSVAQVARHLVPNPNLPDHLKWIAVICEELAGRVLDVVPDGPELTAGLRKLLEAKDCFVRARLDGDREPPDPTHDPVVDPETLLGSDTEEEIRGG